MIRITSKTAGFRRCGIPHPATATEYPDKTFAAEQLKALQGTPELVVEILPNKEEKPEKTGTSAVNVTLAAELILKAATVEELEEITQGDERKGVQDAKAKRLAELTKPEE